MQIEMKRVNTKLSLEQHEWLENESKRKGISKSTLIMMAVEKFMKDSIDRDIRVKEALKNIMGNENNFQ